MYTVSAAAGTALTNYASVGVTGTVLFQGSPVAGGVVPIVGGRLTFDREAVRYARGKVLVGVDVQDVIGLPVSANDPLTAYGYELAVTWTVNLSTGPVDIPLGVFPIQRSNVDSPSGLVTLDVEDRSRIVSDARTKDTYEIAGGVDLFTAVEDLIRDGYPTLTTNFPSTTRVSTASIVPSQVDRFARASDMIRSAGFVLRFDRNGDLTAVPEPSLSDDPVLTISDGVQLASAGVRTDRTKIYNTVVAVGINASLTGDPPRAEASFTTGPLAVGSGFNERVRFYTSPFIADADHAAAAATSILNAQASMEAIPVTIAADPRLDGGDVVHLDHAALSVTGAHILDRYTLNLDPSAVASPGMYRAGGVNSE